MLDGLTFFLRIAGPLRVASASTARCEQSGQPFVAGREEGGALLEHCT